MSISYAVSTIFKAKDYVSQAFGKMSNSAKHFGSTSDRAFRQASKSGSHFRGVVAGVVTAFAIRRGLAMAQQGVSSLVKSYVDFDDAIYSAAAKTKGLNLATKEGQAVLEQYRQAAMKTGRDTKFGVVDSAQAINTFAQAGYRGFQILAALPGAANLATVAQETLAESVGMSVQMMGAFNMRSDDAETHMRNAAKLNDMLAVAITSSTANMRGFYEAASSGAATFIRSGEQSVATFLTLVSLLAEAAIHGEEAGTAIRNMQLRLTASASGTRKALAALRINPTKDGKNFKDMIDILGELHDKTKNMGSFQKTRIFQDIFEVRAATASAILASKTWDSIVKLRTEIDKSAGAMDSMASIVKSSLGNVWELVTSNIETKAVQVFQKFRVEAVASMTALSNAIEKLNENDIAGWLRRVLNGMKALYKVGVTLYRGFKPFIDVAVWGLKLIADNAEALVPYLRVIAWSLVAYAAAAPIASIIRWVALTWKLVAAQGVLNALLISNPVGAIVMGVALLAMAGVWVYRNWGRVAGVFKKIWVLFDKNPLLYLLPGIGNLVLLAKMLINPWTTVKNIFEAIWKAFKNLVDFGKPLWSLFNMSPTGTGGMSWAQPQAPNQAEVDRHKISFDGRLNIFGAPPGSQVTSRTIGAPEIRMDMMGVNP